MIVTGLSQDERRARPCAARLWSSRAAPALGLRVIDGSIMPTMTSTNTNATILMIAERAADMLLEEARRADGPAAHESTQQAAA